MIIVFGCICYNHELRMRRDRQGMGRRDLKRPQKYVPSLAMDFL